MTSSACDAPATLDVESMAFFVSHYPAVELRAGMPVIVGYYPPVLMFSVRTDKPVGDPPVRLLKHHEQFLPIGWEVTAQKEPVKATHEELIDTINHLVSAICDGIRKCFPEASLSIPDNFSTQLGRTLDRELIAQGAFKIVG